MVDLRNRTAFAAGHVPGSLNFGLDGGFATYLGWLIPWGTPVTLLGETAEEVAEAQRELVRIGIDRPAAAATGGPEDWAGPATSSGPSGPRRSPTSPRSATTARSPSSTSGATTSARAVRIDGAVHIPLHELLDRLDEVPAGRGLGALRRRLPRLDRRVPAGRPGQRVVAVDDGFDNAARSACRGPARAATRRACS